MLESSQHVSDHEVVVMVLLMTMHAVWAEQQAKAYLWGSAQALAKMAL